MASARTQPVSDPHNNPPTVRDRIEILARCDLFAGLSEALLLEVARSLRTLRARRGQQLFLRGDPGDALYLVVTGLVRLSIASLGGRELTLHMAAPGSVFGEIALLDGGPRTATATCPVPSTLLALGRREFLDIALSRPEMPMRIMDFLCRRLRQATRQIEELTFAPVPIRLARTLLRLAESQGVEFEDGAGLSTTQQELGNAIGLSREGTNRLLKSWQASGLVAVTKGRISVCSASALQRIARSRAAT
jgi:CRP-like cAMP-binding protein